MAVVSIVAVIRDKLEFASVCFEVDEHDSSLVTAICPFGLDDLRIQSVIGDRDANKLRPDEILRVLVTPKVTPAFATRRAIINGKFDCLIGCKDDKTVFAASCYVLDFQN